jgi:hypothetical protein
MGEEEVEVQLLYLMRVVRDDVIKVLRCDDLLHGERKDDLPLLEVLQVVIV